MSLHIGIMPFIFSTFNRQASGHLQKKDDPEVVGIMRNAILLGWEKTLESIDCQDTEKEFTCQQKKIALARRCKQC